MKYSEQILGPEEQPETGKYSESILGEPQETAQQPIEPPEGEMLTRVRRKIEENGGVMSNIADFFTGSKRTEYDIPEFDLPFEFSGRQAKTALGLMTTFDPQRELKILQNNYPDLKFSQDKFGNIIADGSAYGGGVGYINKPGISLRDIADAGFQIAAFTPAGKAGGLATTTLGKMAATGGAAAGTELGLDIAGQATTGEVKASDVDLGNIAIAGFGGSTFELLSQVLSKTLPVWRQSRRKITDSIRQQFKQAAKNPDEVTDDVIKSFLDAADDAVSPEQAMATQQASEFGIPYTKGQATGATKQLQLEDSLRHGAFGPRGQDILTNFADSTQKPAILKARAGIQRQIGQSGIESPVGAGEMVREGVKSRAKLLDDAISEAYDAVGDAYLDPKNMSGMMKSITRASKSVDFITDPKLVPSTSRFLKDVSEFTDFLDNSGMPLRAFHIKKIEAIRRRINSHISSAANATDQRQMIIMKNTFDDYLDSAVDNALLKGDDTALEALKEARGLRTEYAIKFQQLGTKTRSGRAIKDEAGDIMERLVSSDPTDEQVINYVFGANKLGGKQAGAKIAGRLKTVLGKDSPEWQSVREAAFLKLTEPKNGIISGRVFQNRLDEAVKNSPSLMNTLFTPEEVGLFSRYAKAVVRAQPEILNPSKTAYKSAQIAQQLWEKIAVSMGFHIGGIPGAVGGKVASQHTKHLANWRATRAAKKAIEGQQYPLKTINLGRLGAPAAVAASED